MTLKNKSKNELIEQIEGLQEELEWRTQVMREHPLSLMSLYLEGNTVESFRVLSYNGVAEFDTGKQEQKVVGKTFGEAFPDWLELDDDGPLNLYMQAALSQQIQGMEFSYPLPTTNEIAHVKVTIYPWGDRGVSAVHQVITREKEAERALKEKLETIEAQQNAIRELSTPIIPIMEQIIVVPLVGHIDSGRAKELMRALLAGISEHRAKVVIIDITGVPFVDTGVVNHLDKTIQAARLKGARTIITGISDVVAETIVDLGINWQQTQTLRDLQTGLMVAFKSIGLKVQK